MRNVCWAQTWQQDSGTRSDLPAPRVRSDQRRPWIKQIQRVFSSSGNKKKTSILTSQCPCSTKQPPPPLALLRSSSASAHSCCNRIKTLLDPPVLKSPPPPGPRLSSVLPWMWLEACVSPRRHEAWRTGAAASSARQQTWLASTFGDGFHAGEGLVCTWEVQIPPPPKKMAATYA